MVFLLHFGFSSLLDIDKLIRNTSTYCKQSVLVLCWILINLYIEVDYISPLAVLVLCWILINLYRQVLPENLPSRFSSLLDIDKLIQFVGCSLKPGSFSSLLDIDKLIPQAVAAMLAVCFSSLLDIDKLIPDRRCSTAMTRF